MRREVVKSVRNFGLSLVANAKNVQLLTEQSGYYLDELQVRTTHQGVCSLAAAARKKSERGGGLM
jgi:hypothetical protein